MTVTINKTSQGRSIGLQGQSVEVIYFPNLIGFIPIMAIDLTLSNHGVIRDINNHSFWCMREVMSKIDFFTCSFLTTSEAKETSLSEDWH